MPRSILALLVAVLLVAPAASAQDAQDAQDPKKAERMPDVRPPFGVLDGNVFDKGTVSFSYRFRHQALGGLMLGDGEVSATSLANLYAVVPLYQNDDSHLFELTWTPFEEITLAFTLPYQIKKMQQVYQGVSYETESRGFGDFGMSLRYRIFEDRRSRSHLQIGLSFPSGSIMQTDQVPWTPTPSQLTRLPYSMQLGSGTLDLRIGFSYNGHWKRNYWGVQLEGLLHAGTNDLGYKQGNWYRTTGWLGRRWLPWIGTSFRVDWKQWFNPQGSDPLLDPSVSPANDPFKQAGRRLDALFGLDLYIDGGLLEGTRLSAEAGLPAYQNLDGPQLATQWIITAGIQHVF